MRSVIGPIGGKRIYEIPELHSVDSGAGGAAWGAAHAAGAGQDGGSRIGWRAVAPVCGGDECWSIHTGCGVTAQLCNRSSAVGTFAGGATYGIALARRFVAP